ncbi:MAG: phosphoglucosamine mutase, partial [Candidatus Marinimicrobia bacterium]|nr:phosphoglucosamine mutase [Candidatus Neomarinimicrobiota bacterium]
VKYASALARLIPKNGKIIIGRDSRVSGEHITGILTRTLTWAGCEVVEVGIVPTPTVQLLVETKNAAAGIAITASHNPFPWNGLKFIDKTGRFFNAAQMQSLIDYKNSDEMVAFCESGDFAAHSEYTGAMADHIQNVLDIPWIYVDKIRARKYKVVVDAVNGGASVFIPALLRELGCEVVELYCTPDGNFPHTPEPLPQNLTKLCKVVAKEGADLGMAIDPDGDRLAIVDENGKFISEEYTLVMSVKTVLEKSKVEKPLVVTNLSTTLAVDDITHQFGGEVIRTAIGEINVSQAMAEKNAVIGGEGNGGIILPDSHLGRDSLVGAALILQFMTENKDPISKLFAELPQYKMSKKKMELGSMNPEKVLDSLKKNHSNDEINTVDGLKIIFSDRWVHIRKSNTEPIIRIYSEAPTMEAAEKLGNDIINEVNELLG